MPSSMLWKTYMIYIFGRELQYSLITFLVYIGVTKNTARTKHTNANDLKEKKKKRSQIIFNEFKPTLQDEI